MGRPVASYQYHWPCSGDVFRHLGGESLSTMVNHCSIIGCSKTSKRDKISFFRLPAVIKNQGERTLELSEKRRHAWLTRINRDDITHHSIRVCALHFIKGKPSTLYNHGDVDWAPSLQLGDQNHRKRRRLNHTKAQKTKERHKEVQDHDAAESLLSLCNNTSVHKPEKQREASTPPESVQVTGISTHKHLLNGSSSPGAENSGDGKDFSLVMSQFYANQLAYNMQNTLFDEGLRIAQQYGMADFAEELKQMQQVTGNTSNFNQNVEDGNSSEVFGTFPADEKEVSATFPADKNEVSATFPQNNINNTTSEPTENGGNMSDINENTLLKVQPILFATVNGTYFKVKTEPEEAINGS